MPLAERRADVTWKGDLRQGTGMVTPRSGAFADYPVTWASRTESSDGKTSPEELLASAHASCFAMALANAISQSGTAPEELRVSAVCTLDRVDGAVKITRMDINVGALVPGMDDAAFRSAVQQAEQGCPVSNALRNNVEITVSATKL